MTARYNGIRSTNLKKNLSSKSAAIAKGCNETRDSSKSARSAGLAPKADVSNSLDNKKEIIRKRINTRFKKAWDELAEL